MTLAPWWGLQAVVCLQQSRKIGAVVVEIKMVRYLLRRARKGGGREYQTKFEKEDLGGGEKSFQEA